MINTEPDNAPITPMVITWVIGFMFSFALVLSGWETLAKCVLVISLVAGVVVWIKSEIRYRKN